MAYPSLFPHFESSDVACTVMPNRRARYWRMGSEIAKATFSNGFDFKGEKIDGVCIEFAGGP